MFVLLVVDKFSLSINSRCEISDPHNFLTTALYNNSFFTLLMLDAISKRPNPANWLVCKEFRS